MIQPALVRHPAAEIHHDGGLRQIEEHHGRQPEHGVRLTELGGGKHAVVFVDGAVLVLQPVGAW